MLQAIGSIATESPKEFAFLIAVETDGQATFMEVIQCGYDIRNARVIFVAEMVQHYGHLTQCLKDIGMRWGMTEWLTMQLEERDSTDDFSKTRASWLKMRLQQAETECDAWRAEAERLQDVMDQLIENQEAP